ncbi:MAG: hypothetical protein E7Z62_01485 [Thermoplasmata archaeon]|nr:hypothetical protein [Thermoplasmata archaeon]
MQFDNRILAAAMALAFIVGAFSLVGSEVDADPEITRDYGEFYSYTLQFVFDGADAQTIDWDFGDNTEHSNEWNPRHTYAAVGTYFVTQTTTNTQGTTTEIYKVQVMGYPKLTFNSNGGSAVSEIQMDSYNATATRPADPIRDGYTFDGWYCEATFENAMDWTAGITRSMTLYAKWTPVQAPAATHTVTFDSNGGSPVQAQTVQDGMTATAPANPTRDGYVFSVWFLGSRAYSFDTPVTQDITLTAVWSQVPETVYRTVTFNVDGGSTTVPMINVESGTQITLPGYTGTKEGYAFGGWSCNSTTYQPGQPFTVSSDIVFKAVWRSTAPVVSEIVVTFNVDGGSKPIAAMNIQSGGMFTFPEYDGTKEDCTFGGWACGLQVYQPGQSVQLTGDVTVKAIWNAAESGSGDDVNDVIDQIKDFVEKNLVLCIIILVLIVLAILYIRSRRMY